MHSKKKSYRRKVTALVDATPSFVSVVDRGASGSPFTCVKHEDKPMKVNRRKAAPAKTAAAKSNKGVKTPEQKKSENATETKRETMIVSFSFDKENFATVDDVKKFMDDSDFEGEMVFEETDDTILVKNADAEDVAFLRKEVIDTGDEGVTAEVGSYEVEAETVTKSEDDDPEDEDDDLDDDEDDSAKSYDDKKKPKKKEADPAPVAAEAEEKPVLSKREQFLANLRKGTASPVKKFDHYDVWVENNDTSFANLLKAGMSDGAAPGFEDVLWTFGQAVRKTLNAGGDSLSESLRKDAGALVDLVIAQNALFESVVSSSADDVKKAEAPASYESLQKWATEFGLALIEDDSEQPAKVSKSANNPVIAEDADVEAVVAKQLNPLMETVGRLAQTVEKLSNRRQVSKSIPAPDAAADEDADTQSTKKRDVQKAQADEVGNVIFGR